MLHLPKNIKLIRQLTKENQTQFGSRFDATKAMIISYESGKASPSLLFLERLAKFSGINESDLQKKPLKEEDIRVEKEEKVSSDTNLTADNDSLQSLSKAILVISESNKGLVDQHQSIIEANRVIANTNQVLAQKIINEPVRTNGDEGSVAVATSIIPTVLDLMAEIGIGHLWQTKAEGIAEIGRRLNVPSVVKRKDDHNVSGAGRKRTA